MLKAHQNNKLKHKTNDSRTSGNITLHFYTYNISVGKLCLQLVFDKSITNARCSLWKPGTLETEQVPNQALIVCVLHATCICACI